MDKISCVNCSHQVNFNPEKMRCENCNIRDYGYNINNLPPVFKQKYNDYIKGGPTKPPETPTNTPESPIKKPETPYKPKLDKFGWLVLHTEGKQKRTFEIKKGINFIGRENSDFKPDIIVNDDKYVSRGHAHIQASIENNNYKYILCDNSDNQSGNASLNGTYLNGNKNKLDSNYRGKNISDGDTIQIGETKFVLKTPDNVTGDKDATKIVKTMDYTKTIIINRN